MHEDAVRRTLAEHGRLAVDAASLTDEDDLYAAGLTSHATVDVMLALEDELGFEFPADLLRRSTFQTIASLSAAVGEAAGA